jgi:hypothetical protein
VGKLASGDPQKKHTPREARGKKYGYKPGHMMGKAFIGEDSARSAEKKNFLGKPKLGSSEGFSDRPGLGKSKETPREAREKKYEFCHQLFLRIHRFSVGARSWSFWHVLSRCSPGKTD